MAGELSEKAEGQSRRTSSHGDSTDEHESTTKPKAEADAVQVPSNDPNALAKLDSNIKVEVKDEDADDDTKGGRIKERRKIEVKVEREDSF